MSIRSRVVAVALAALTVVGISPTAVAGFDGLVDVRVGGGLISDIGVEEAAHIWAGICGTDYDEALALVSSVDGTNRAIRCFGAPIVLAVSDN